MKKLLLDVTEIMDMLGVDAPGLAALIREQRLPAVDVAGEIKFHEPDLRHWLRDYANANTLSPNSESQTIEQAVEHSEERASQRRNKPRDPAEAARLFATIQPAEPAARPQDQQVLFDIDVLDDLIEQYEAGQTPHTQSPPSHAGEPPAPPRPEPVAPIADEPAEIPADLCAVAEEPPEAEPRAVFLSDAFAIRFMLFEARIKLKRGAAKRKEVMDETARVLQDMNIDIADFEQVKLSLIRNEGRWVRLAEVPSPFLDKVNILIAPDRRRAYLVAGATDINTPISQMHITEELDRNGIRTGVDHEACRRVVQERLFGHLVIAAQGREPVPGKDAELTYHFNRDRALTPETLDPESQSPVREVLGKQRAKVSHELDKCMAAIAKLKQKAELNPQDTGLLQTLKANAHKARGLTDILSRLDQDTAYPQVLINIEGRLLRTIDDFKTATFAVDRDDRIITI